MTHHLKSTVHRVFLVSHSCVTVSCFRIFLLPQNKSHIPIISLASPHYSHEATFSTNGSGSSGHFMYMEPCLGYFILIAETKYPFTKIKEGKLSFTYSLWRF